MNGYPWSVYFVNPYDSRLMDRTNTMKVATTDPISGCIYLSNELSGDMLLTVLLHELGHCALFSFDLLPEIHQMVKRKYWIEAEEWVCNFIADYGLMIFNQAYNILGDSAWLEIPPQLERLYVRRRRF